jgi:hypothetical protein
MDLSKIQLVQVDYIYIYIYIYNFFLSYSNYHTRKLSSIHLMVLLSANKNSKLSRLFLVLRHRRKSSLSLILLFLVKNQILNQNIQ